MSITAEGSGTATFCGFSGGATAAVSLANEARIRYNTTLNRIEVSENGGAYVPFGLAGSYWSRTVGGFVYPTTNTDTFGFAANATTPLIYQDRAAADASGLKLTIQAQQGGPLGALLGTDGGPLALLYGDKVGTGTDGYIEMGVRGGAFATVGTLRTPNGFGFYCRNSTGTGNLALLAGWTDNKVYVGSDVGDSGLILRSATSASVLAPFSEMGAAGSTFATSGVLRLPDTFNATWINGATNYALWSAQGTQAWVGGAYPNRPSNVVCDASSAVNLMVGGGNVIVCTSGSAQIYKPSILWDASVAGPTLTQTSDPAAGVTADNLTIQAQAATDVAGPAANVGGTLNLYAGNAAGPLASVGGSVIVQAANATAAGVGSNGGHVSVWYGSGATNGYISMGLTGSTIGASGALRVPDTFNATWRSGGVDYALWSAQGTHAYVGGSYPTKPTNIYVDASSVVGLMAGVNMVLSTYLLLNFSNVAFGATTGAPLLNQNDSSVAGTTCYDFTISAQGTTDAGGTSKSGNLGLRGGIGGGGAGNTDGNVWFHVSPGALATWKSGEKIIHIANAVTEPSAIDDTGAFLWAYSNNLRSNANLMLGDTGTLPASGDIGLPSGFTMVVKSSTGDATFLTVDAGDDIHLGSNDADLDDLYLDVATGCSINATIAGTSRLFLSSTVLEIDVTNLRWHSTTVAPHLYQERAASDVNGASLTVQAQEGGPLGGLAGTDGGDLYLESGDNAGTGAEGWVLFGLQNSIAKAGAGTRGLFNPTKAAFRAGYVAGTTWDDANVGSYSFAGGDSTTASGTGAVAFGGTTIASGTNTLAFGTSVTAALKNELAHGNSISANADCQDALVSTGRSSTDAGSVELTLDNTAPAAGTRLAVPSGKLFTFVARVGCICTAGTNAGKCAGWIIHGCIKNIGGTTALVGTPQRLSEGAVPVAANVAVVPTHTDFSPDTPTITLSADDANDCLVVTATGIVGASANTFHWNGSYTISEVA